MAWIVFNETWGLLTRRTAGITGSIRPIRRNGCAACRRVKGNGRYASWRITCRNYDHVETDINTWHFYLNGYMTVKEHIDIAAKGGHEGSGWNFIRGKTVRLTCR